MTSDQNAAPYHLEALAIDPTGELSTPLRPSADPHVLPNPDDREYLIRLDIDGTDPANSPGYDPGTGEIAYCVVGNFRDSGGNPVQNFRGLTFSITSPSTGELIGTTSNPRRPPFTIRLCR